MSLTEDWKAKELLYGKSYWCCGKEDKVEMCTLGYDNKFYSGVYEVEGIEEVLAICDYEEVQQLKADLKFMKESQAVEDKELQEAREENSILINRCMNLERQGAGTRIDLESERIVNEQLRNLLKECAEFLSNVDEYRVKNADEAYLLITRINAAIGEEE